MRWGISPGCRFHRRLPRLQLLGTIEGNAVAKALEENKLQFLGDTMDRTSADTDRQPPKSVAMVEPRDAAREAARSNASRVPDVVANRTGVPDSHRITACGMMGQ